MENSQWEDEQDIVNQLKGNRCTFLKAVFKNTLSLLNSTLPTMLFAKEWAHVLSMNFIIIYLAFTFQNELFITIRSIF